MYARYKDSENRELNCEEKLISIDFHTCPITRQIIRYPVLAADGHHYELQALLRYVEGGRADSPIRRGQGTVFPVLYNPICKEILDQLFSTHPDRHPDYVTADVSIDDFIEQLAEYEENLAPSIPPQPPVAAPQVRPVPLPLHVEIGNQVALMSFLYFVINWFLVLFANVYLFSSEKERFGTFNMISLEALILTLAMTIAEGKLRVSNNNQGGICKSITDTYYSLFKRPQNPAHLPLSQPPLHPQQ